MGPRRSGVAIMQERAALQQQEGVLELVLSADLTSSERWHSCVIFRCSGLVSCAMYARVQRLARHGFGAGAGAIFRRLGLPCTLITQLGRTCSDSRVSLS